MSFSKGGPGWGRALFWGGQGQRGQRLFLIPFSCPEPQRQLPWPGRMRPRPEFVDGEAGGRRKKLGSCGSLWRLPSRQSLAFYPVACRGAATLKPTQNGWRMSGFSWTPVPFPRRDPGQRGARPGKHRGCHAQSESGHRYVAHALGGGAPPAGGRGWAPSGPGIWTGDGGQTPFHISGASRRDPSGSHLPTRRDGRGRGPTEAKAQSREAERLMHTCAPREAHRQKSPVNGVSGADGEGREGQP